MANLENDNTNFEEQQQFSEQQTEHHINGASSDEEPALTLRALVSTKEAGVIIGKGKKGGDRG